MNVGLKGPNERAFIASFRMSVVNSPKTKQKIMSKITFMINLLMRFLAFGALKISQKNVQIHIYPHLIV